MSTALHKCSCGHPRIAHNLSGVCWHKDPKNIYCGCAKFELESIDVPLIPHKPAGINPKDLIGAKKVDLSIIPPISAALQAEGLMDGDGKYGPFNWRNPDKKVSIRTYIAACKRHLDLFMEGEEAAKDSGIPHLGHAMAGLAVITDAYYNGFAHDDRPPVGKYPEQVETINQRIKQKAETK